MLSLIPVVLGCAIGTTDAVYMGQAAVTLYQHARFTGRSFTLRHQSDDVKSSGWTRRTCDYCPSPRGPRGERYYNDQISSVVVHPGSVVRLYKHCCSPRVRGQQISPDLGPGHYHMHHFGIANDELSYVRFQSVEDYVKVRSVTTCFNPIFSFAGGGSESSYVEEELSWTEGISHSQSVERVYARQAFWNTQASASASAGFFSGGASASATASVGTSRGRAYQSSIRSAYSHASHSERTRTRTYHLRMSQPVWIANVEVTIRTNIGRVSSSGGLIQLTEAPEELCHVNNNPRRLDEMDTFSSGNEIDSPDDAEVWNPLALLNDTEETQAWEMFNATDDSEMEPVWNETDAHLHRHPRSRHGGRRLSAEEVWANQDLVLRLSAEEVLAKQDENAEIEPVENMSEIAASDPLSETELGAEMEQEGSHDEMSVLQVALETRQLRRNEI